jgi:hypothetical protein
MTYIYKPIPNAIVKSGTTWYLNEYYVDCNETIQSIEDIQVPQPTGLLDAVGTPLYKVAVRSPIGDCK